MESETFTLIIIWFLAVVAFFALWAVLLKVIKRISDRKNKAKDNAQGEVTQENASPDQPS